jgi:hypothetical protein
MDDSQLQELLDSIESDASAVRLQPDLAKRVRRRVKRRARIRGFSAATIFLVVCAGAVTFLVRDFRRRQVIGVEASAGDVAIRLRAEIDDLNVRANQHETMAKRLEQLESMAAMERKIGGDPILELTTDRAAAAGILVARAKELERDRSISEAIAQYQRIVELFADTPQAIVAERRLRDIKISSSTEGDVLYSGVDSCHGEFCLESSFA